MSVFCFVDKIAELKKNESITTYFTLTGEEEFLKDHFEGFPVMPGVLLLEALKQAAVSFLKETEKSGVEYHLLEANDVKFGQFVKPGSTLKVFARRLNTEGQAHLFDGRIDLVASEAGTSQGKALTAGIKLVPIQ